MSVRGDIWAGAGNMRTHFNNNEQIKSAYLCRNRDINPVTAFSIHMSAQRKHEQAVFRGGLLYEGTARRTVPRSGAVRISASPPRPGFFLALRAVRIARLRR